MPRYYKRTLKPWNASEYDWGVYQDMIMKASPRSISVVDRCDQQMMEYVEDQKHINPEKWSKFIYDLV